MPSVLQHAPTDAISSRDQCPLASGKMGVFPVTASACLSLRTPATYQSISSAGSHSTLAGAPGDTSKGLYGCRHMAAAREPQDRGTRPPGLASRKLSKLIVIVMPEHISQEPWEGPTGAQARRCALGAQGRQARGPQEEGTAGGLWVVSGHP